MKTILLITILFISGNAFAQEVLFNRDIRPILTHKCASCHGGVKRAGGVSFTNSESPYKKDRKGIAPIVPGKPGDSEVMRRITSDDPDERMPPTDEHPEGLSKQEIDLIRKWIQGGAVWEKHWAYERPKTHPAPKVSDSMWIKSKFDPFVLHRLDQEGLKPSPEADKAQWLRRASFDLIGLPPSQEELDNFKADTSEEAYKKVVDRLLNSKSFGERWAAMWLDLARYADSQGYEKDNHRNIWAYRDWLINAFNEDMPYDAFTVKQLAGDLLENSTISDQVATAFHRNTQTNTEGGTDDEEFRLSAVIDRVNTTWTVWQASTFGCVQCHSHPYDPFDHKEYYNFLAYFNNTSDADLNDDFPRVKVPSDPAQHERARELDKHIGEFRKLLNESGTLATNPEEWKEVKVNKVEGPNTASFLINRNEVEVEGTVPQGSTYKVEVTGNGRITALKINLLPKERDTKKLPEHGAVLSQIKAEYINEEGKKEEIKFADVFAESLTGPFDPYESLNKGAQGGGSFPKIFKPTWLVFVLEKPIVRDPETPFFLYLSCRVRGAETKGAIINRFSVQQSCDTAWEKLITSPKRIEIKDKWNQLRAERNKIQSNTVPVMRERPENAKRPTHVFVRGNFLEKAQSVQPGVPSLVGDLGTVAPSPRLKMAKWIANPKNPLTSRVIVNRIWAELFGLGIVETIEDFGTKGEAPSHPKLLDDLASRFQTEHRWKLKSLLRELVLSATYRQTHKVTPEHLEKDPRNRLLARGPRTRLTAEMIRDQALKASGLLSKKMLGPSVMPPQPDGVWTVVYSGARWRVPKGEDRYRRGLYTYMRRTSPYPSFLTFDAPSREVCVARRIPTNTPLQALVTLNDPVYIECAQALAKKMVEKGGESLLDQIAYGYSLATQKTANPKVITKLSQLYDIAKVNYQEDKEESDALAKTPGEAALVLVANTLLNLDAALTK